MSAILPKLQYKAMNKLCRFIFRQNPLRCIVSLKNEHIRIKSTIQSFERLLDKMQSESHPTNTVSKEHLRDLESFLKFCKLYNGVYHMSKEHILCKHAETIPNLSSKLLYDIESDHRSGQNLYELMEMRSGYISEAIEDKVNLLDNVMIPCKSHIKLLYDHITKEDTMLFVEIINNSSESEMEKISRSLDKCDSQNHEVINAMEVLSDELMSKYN
eukprot:136477_1